MTMPTKKNTAKYSQELIDIITYLLQGEVDINTLISKLAIRYIDELSNAYGYADSLENELAKELENGRLFRILVKLNFVAQHEEYVYYCNFCFSFHTQQYYSSYGHLRHLNIHTFH